MGNKNIGTPHQVKSLLSKNKLLAISFAVATCTALLVSAGWVLVPKYQYYSANASEKCQINLAKANNPDLFCTATNTVANYSDIHKENKQSDTPAVSAPYSNAPKSYGDSPVPTFDPSPATVLPPNPRLAQNTSKMKYGVTDTPAVLNVNSTQKSKNSNNIFLWLTVALLIMSVLGSVVGSMIFSRYKKHK